MAHYRSHKCSPPVLILSQLDPVHIPTTPKPKLHSRKSINALILSLWSIRMCPSHVANTLIFYKYRNFEGSYLVYLCRRMVRIGRTVSIQYVKMHCFIVNLAVHTVTAVFWRANYCVQCAESGPCTGSGSKCSGYVEQRSCFTKQPQK